MYKLGSDLISCLLQYSNPCAMLNQNKNFCIVTNLESHPKRKILQIWFGFFWEKKISWCQLFVYKIPAANIPSPLYYTTYISIYYSQIKIVWLHYILPTHVHQVCIKTKPHILLKIIFKWKQSWMIGALIIIISILFLEVLFLVFLLYYYYKKQK